RTRPDWDPPPKVPAFDKPDGAIGRGVPGPHGSCSEDDTWSGWSSGSHLHPAAWRKFPPAPERADRLSLHQSASRPDRRSAARAADRVPHPVEGRSALSPVLAAAARSLAARSAVPGSASRWRVKPRVRRRPRRSIHWPKRGSRPPRSRLFAVRRQRDAQQCRNFFLDVDDGLGTDKAPREMGIIPLQARHFGGQRVGFGGFWAAFAGNQRADYPGLAQPAPVAKSGRVQAFTAKDRADPTGVGGTVGLGQDAQLVLDGEGPAAGRSGNFRRHGGRCLIFIGTEGQDHCTTVAIHPNPVSELWKVFPEAGRTIDLDASALQDFLREALCRKTEQVTNVLKPVVRRKVLRVAPMASRRVGEGVDHGVTFARVEGSDEVSWHHDTPGATAALLFDRRCVARRSPPDRPAPGS